MLAAVLACFASIPDYAHAEPDPTDLAAAAVRERRAVRWCVLKFQSVMNGQVMKRRQHAKNIIRKIEDFFPNHADLKKNVDGRIVNYSDTEMKDFEEAVDAYFDYYHWKSSEVLELRQHFRAMKGGDGKPYPPRAAADIQGWIQKGYTFEQMMTSYRTRYLLGSGSNLLSREEIDQIILNFGPKTVGMGVATGLKKAVLGAKALLTTNWKATLGGASAALIGGGFVTAGIEFLPESWRFTQKDIKNNIRVIAQDREVLHNAKKRFIASVEDHKNSTYSNDEVRRSLQDDRKSLADWKKFDEHLVADLSELARESVILKDPPLPRPTSLKGVSGDFQGVINEQMNEYDRVVAAYEEIRVKLSVFDTANPPESRNAAQEAKRRLLVKGVEEYQVVMEVAESELARLLAYWHLNNTLLRVLYVGEQQAAQAPKKANDAPFKPVKDFEIYKYERDKIDKRIADFRKRGFFDKFTLAQGEILTGWVEDMKKNVK